MTKRRKPSLTRRPEASKKRAQVQQRLSSAETREHHRESNRQCQRTRRADSETRADENAANASRMHSRRSDSEARAEENVVNATRMRDRRSVPQVRATEQVANTAAKRAKTHLNWEQAVAQFEEAVKDGPSHRCFSCDRLFFTKQMRKRTRAHMNSVGWTDELITELIVPDHANDDVFNFCASCNNHFAKSRKKLQPGEEAPAKKFPKFNANKANLKFPDLPEELLTLSPVEERTVALRTPFMKIMALGCDRQYGIKSGVINVPTEFERTVQSLPANPNDCGVIEVRLMRKMMYKSAYMKERIRPAVVWRVAEYLVTQELYKHLKLDRNWQENQQRALEELDREESGGDQYTDEELKQLFGLSDEEVVEFKETLAQHVGLNELEPDPEAIEANEGYIEEETMLDVANEGIAINPSEGQRPIPMFLDKFYKEMSWPTIWGGNPIPDTPEGVKISESDKSHHEVLRYDRRGCKPAYLLFLHKVETLRQLQNATSIAMRKSAQTNNITASQVLDKQFIQNAVRQDNCYYFMSSIVGSPAYWENKKKNVLAMVRQFGIFTLFITLTAAETKWPELLALLKKIVDKEEITLEEASELPFPEISRLIRSDPVTCARFFDHRFKELKKTWTHCSDGPFGDLKIAHMFYRIEFQHRGSPHVHMIIWLEGAPKYESGNPESEDEVINFIDSLITTSSDDPEVADQVGKQYHKCSHTCFKGTRQKCRFNAPFCPMDKTRIIAPLEKEEESQLDPEVVKKIREFNTQIDNELNHNSGNIVSFDELLTKMGVDIDFYLLATKATIKHPKIFLKRAPKDARINGYNKKILLTMRSNMDIQFVLDAYACIGYIVDYVNKSARGLSRLLRLCIEDCRRGNKSIRDQMKALAHILYDSTEVSAQEAAWCRCRLSMCAMTEAVEFIHSGPPDKRQRMLKRSAELKKLPEGSTDIYAKGAIDRYAVRPDVLEGLCLAEFVANFTYCNKNGQAAEESEEVPAVDEDNVETEELEIVDDENATRKLRSYPLTDGSGIVRERRRQKVIRYCRFSYFQDPLNYFREMCFLFFPWRNESEDIGDSNWEELYTANEEVIKANFRKFNASDIDFDLIAREIEENRQAEEQDQNEQQQQDDQNEEPLYVNAYDFDENVIRPDAALEMGYAPTGCGGASRYKIPGIYDKEKYLQLMDSSNKEQRDFIMHINSLVFYNEVPFYCFLTGGAGTGKSHTIKAAFQSLIRQYRSNPSEETTPEILIVSFTGMAAHNVDGMTAHSAFHLSAGKTTNYVPLNPNMKNTLRCNLGNLKLLIIDEISMLSSNHLHQISCRLGEIFNTPARVPFGGISVIVVGDFNQLPPVAGSLVFKSKDPISPASMILNPQWAVFNLFRLNEIMRQRDDKAFSEALNRLAVVKCTPEDIAMWNSRVFKEENLPERALKATRLFEYHKDIDVYNNMIIERKKASATYKIVSIAEDRIIGNPTPSQRNQAINALKKVKTEDAQGLLAELELVDNVRYMMTVNIKVLDGLCNGAKGILRRIDFERVPGQQIIKSTAVWIEFDNERIGVDTRRDKQAFMRVNNIPPTWTPIYKISRQFNLLAHGSVQINRTQYPLVPAEATTIHKSQGLTQDIVLDSKGKTLDRQKTYTALSRPTSLEGVFILNSFKVPNPPRHDDAVIREMTRMESDSPLVPTFKHLRIRSEEEYLQIISHNVQSLNAHIKSLTCDETYTCSDILMFQESWLKTSDTIAIDKFQEVSRNQLVNARGKGTIIYKSEAASMHLSEGPAMERNEASGHCEISSVVVAGNLLLLNVYKNPDCSRATFAKAMERYENIVSRFDNVLAMGDFNEDVKNGSCFNKLMNDKYGLELLSPEKATTTNRTCIDGVFGKLKDYNVVCSNYFSYFSVHFPIVTKVYKK